MAQGNVEWYSVHTNRMALRKMAQRNVGLRQLARVGALIANTTFGTPCKLKHSDITLIEKCQN